MNEREQTLRRLQELFPLQKYLEQKYADADYNVFVFGSYISTRYVEGRSDIDIAVYAADFNVYKRISMDIEEYFHERNIPTDIFYVDITIPAPFYCAALNSKIHFTEYYPIELDEFARQCNQKLNDVKEKIAG